MDFDIKMVVLSAKSSQWLQKLIIIIIIQCFS